MTERESSPDHRATTAEEELERARELAERASHAPAEAPLLSAPATQAAAQQPPEPAQNGAAAALSITLAYETGWNQVYLHHCIDGQGMAQGVPRQMQSRVGY